MLINCQIQSCCGMAWKFLSLKNNIAYLMWGNNQGEQENSSQQKVMFLSILYQTKRLSELLINEKLMNYTLLSFYNLK